MSHSPSRRLRFFRVYLSSHVYKHDTFKMVYLNKWFLECHVFYFKIIKLFFSVTSFYRSYSCFLELIFHLALLRLPQKKVFNVLLRRLPKHYVIPTTNSCETRLISQSRVFLEVLFQASRCGLQGESLKLLIIKVSLRGFISENDGGTPGGW